MNPKEIDEQLVVVATFSWPGEAELAKSSLEAEGIPAFIADQYTVSANWLYSGALGGVKVMVKESDLLAAKDVLDAFSQEVEQDESSQEPTASPNPICPKCGSNSVSYERVHRKIGLLTILLLGLPILLADNKWCCKACQHKWLPLDDGP